MGTARVDAPAPAPAPPPAAADRAAPAVAPPVATVEARSSSGRTAVIAALVVVVAIAGVALWQFGGFGNRAAPVAAQATPAPAVAPPVAAAPDVGPTIANVASVPQWGSGASAPKPPSR
jgi:hypothetical protein